MTKKIVTIIGSLLALILLLWVGQHWLSANSDPLRPNRTIALVPLDSRPCNTQYPQLLCQMAGYSLLLPPTDAMDDFLQPADEEALWQWLTEAAAQSDRLIIFTNELLNGGLISSRNSGSYDHITEQLERLAAFCQQYADCDITVVSILPRLKPSQFDNLLWPYEVELTAWGQALDVAAYHGEPEPPLPTGVPQAIVDGYRSLFSQNQLLADSLADMTQSGWIDQLIIGQDDAEAWCPSNTIYRQLQERQNENLTLIHGADELTMLLVAKAVNQLPPLEVKILYTDPTRQSDYYPYEAADLATIVADKLALAGLTVSDTAASTIIIHNDPAAADRLPEMIAQIPDKLYLGLADIAYTNKGDIALEPLLFDRAMQDRISCYAGWNTASNSLGTVLAHCRISQLAAQNYPWLDQAHRTTVLSAMHSFKYVRLAEDIVYQGLLSNELRTDLQAWDWMVYTNAFRTGYRNNAQDTLDKRFSLYQEQLNALFSGDHQLHLTDRSVSYTVSDFFGTISFPWNRAFEVKAQSTFTLQP